MSQDAKIAAPSPDQLGAIVDEVRRRRTAGENYPDDMALAEHAEHAEWAPLLRPLLHQLAEQSGSRTYRAAAETAGWTATQTSLNVGQLIFRCQFCSTPFEPAESSALAEIVCPQCGSRFDDSQQIESTRSARPVKSLGHFDLVERLGSGAFGTVWKGRDRKLDRTVAVKIPRLSGVEPSDLEKVLREARAVARLKHASIVTVHEVGRDGDCIYLVTDYVRGVTLEHWLTGQRMTMHAAADLCRKIALALDHAHEHGVVHRDLKPSNVMIDGEGQPYLMDFGLARRDQCDDTFTAEGQILGTPAYMSPEQARGEGHTADRRTDVYSLGVILYELITGERPFRGNAQMLVHQVLHDEPPCPHRLNGAVPRDLEAITLKCLEKEPCRRYDTAADAARDLQRFLYGEPVTAAIPGRLGRIVRWYQRSSNALMYTAGGYAMIASLFLTAWALVGLVQMWLGIVPAPGRAFSELLVFATCVYPLFFVSGWLTLNRSTWGLALGTLLSCGWTIALLPAALHYDGGFMRLDLMGSARQSTFAHYQVVSLFLMIAGVGAITHLIALSAAARQALEFRRQNQRPVFAAATALPPQR